MLSPELKELVDAIRTFVEAADKLRKALAEFEDEDSSGWGLKQARRRADQAGVDLERAVHHFFEARFDVLLVRLQDRIDELEEQVRLLTARF